VHFSSLLIPDQIRPHAPAVFLRRREAPDLSIVSHGQADLIDTLIRQLARRAAPGLIGRLVLTLNCPKNPG
jgi:hypothetical protein